MYYEYKCRMGDCTSGSTEVTFISSNGTEGFTEVSLLCATAASPRPTSLRLIDCIINSNSLAFGTPEISGKVTVP